MSREESQAKVKALLDQLDAGVTGILTSEDFAAWLTTMRRFHSYSWSNAWLILSQKPDATRVAGFRTWQKMNRYVRKGEKGIAILVPWTVRGTTEDPQTGEEEAYRKTIFKPGYVFDISQTDGEPLPDAPVTPQMIGEGSDALEPLFLVLERLVLDAGVELAYQTAPRASGFFRAGTEPLISVNTRDPRADQLSTLVHEYAHFIQSRDYKHLKEVADAKLTYAFNETVAEGVAYVVMGEAGLDTACYSFPYIAGWASQDGGTKIIKACLRQVGIIAGTILRELDGDVPAAEAA